MKSYNGNRRVGTILALLISVPTSAGALTYDESVSGDLPFGPSSPILDFDAGINTINGSMSLISQGSMIVGDPQDSARFSLPASTHVSMVALTVENIEFNNVTVAEIRANFGLGVLVVLSTIRSQSTY